MPSVSPDIICLSKALTAGYLPLGATVTTNAIYEAFLSEDRAKTFFHGHSFTANPLACAVAVASLDLFREHDVLARVGTTGVAASRRSVERSPICRASATYASSAASESSSWSATRARGRPTAISTASDRACPRQFLDRGLLLRPLGNVVYFMPPYCITDDQVDWALEQISAVLTAVTPDLKLLQASILL